jgi:hypothetical protein
MKFCEHHSLVLEVLKVPASSPSRALRFLRRLPLCPVEITKPSFDSYVHHVRERCGDLRSIDERCSGLCVVSFLAVVLKAVLLR